MLLPHQPGILTPLATIGRSITFRLLGEADPVPALTRLAAAWEADWGVIGLGRPLVRRLGRDIPGLRSFPVFDESPVAIPSTQQAIWVCLLGDDRSTVFDRYERVVSLLVDAFAVDDLMDTFRYHDGRDLTGYLDGTANPGASESIDVALVGVDSDLRGSSFVAVQRWSHDLGGFRAHSPAERDDIIGRRISDNEEIEEAPESAHVKRTAQELFDPVAFMVRRSMPWTTATGQGLEFIAYGRSLDAFETALRHMAGLDDGITDALFRFSRPVTGGFYWCPPVTMNGLDLAPLGL